MDPIGNNFCPVDQPRETNDRDSGMENGTAGDDDFNMVTDVNEYSQVTRIPSKILTCHGDKELKVIVFTCFVFSISITLALILTIFYGSPQVRPHGIVSSMTRSCSKQGTEVLKEGGTEIEALAITIMCESIYKPELFTLGSSGFIMNHKLFENSTLIVNFSTPTIHEQLGNHAVEVPVLLTGLKVALEKHSSLNWKSIMHPVVTLAKQFRKKDVSLYENIMEKGLQYIYEEPVVNSVVNTMANYEKSLSNSSNPINVTQLQAYQPIISETTVERRVGVNIVKVNMLVYKQYDGVKKCFACLLMHEALAFSVKSSKDYLMKLPSGSATDDLLHLLDLVGDLKDDKKIFYKKFTEAVNMIEKSRSSSHDHKTMSHSVTIVGLKDDFTALTIWSSNDTSLTTPEGITLNINPYYPQMEPQPQQISAFLFHSKFSCRLRLNIIAPNYQQLGQVLYNLHNRKFTNYTTLFNSPRIQIIKNIIYKQENFDTSLLDNGKYELKAVSNVKDLPDMFTLNLVWKDKDEFFEPQHPFYKPHAI